MNKLMIGFGLLIVLVLSAVALHAQQGVVGTWLLTVPGMSMQMVLAQDGEKVSGTIDSPHGVIQLKGDLSRGKLTLTGAPTDQHPVQVTATATLAADGSLAGALSVNLMEVPFTAVRASGK
jgi:hypothetical protein